MAIVEASLLWLVNCGCCMCEFSTTRIIIPAVLTFGMPDQANDPGCGPSDLRSICDH
jgi:hypothetical protein